MVLIFRGSALTREGGIPRWFSSRADPPVTWRHRPRARPGRSPALLRLPPVVRTSSAPRGCPLPRALAETRREFGQDYKAGAAVWYAAVAGADRATTGSGTARALTSACFALTSACQRVSKSRVGSLPSSRRTTVRAECSARTVSPSFTPLIISPGRCQSGERVARRFPVRLCVARDWAARAGTALGGVL